MTNPKVLTLILAGGKGSRLGVLTENRAKPVLPFGGFYRLIDFALSNCLHSGLSDVWIIEQYQLHSLNEHLSNGRPWDLDRTYGGLQVLPPNQNAEGAESDDGFAHGNADAIYRHRKFIRQFNPDILIVLSADHVYKLDFRDVIETHLEKEADVTMVTTVVPENELASRFGVVEVNGAGRITNFAYKPEKPASDLITTEVFVYNAPKLLETLDCLAASGNEENQLEDFGHKLIPQLVKENRAFEFRFNGYWRDVGTIESYWQAHMDLLDERPDFVLDDSNWPILTLATQRVPAFVHSTADVKNSLISHGAKVHGKIERSILAPGVCIEEGAEVLDSIVLHDTVIEKGAKLARAIVDSNIRLNAEKIKRKTQNSDKAEILVFGQENFDGQTYSDSERSRVASNN
jgi:glucose-1-phosphate adenylyltransferase